MQVWNITFIAAFTLFLFRCGCTSSDSSCRTSAKAPGPWLQPRPDPSFWRETRTETERSAGKVSRQEKDFFAGFFTLESLSWRLQQLSCENNKGTNIFQFADIYKSGKICFWTPDWQKIDVLWLKCGGGEYRDVIYDSSLCKNDQIFIFGRSCVLCL